MLNPILNTVHLYFSVYKIVKKSFYYIMFKMNVCCLDLLWSEVESHTHAHITITTIQSSHTGLIDYHPCAAISINKKKMETDSRVKHLPFNLLVSLNFFLFVKTLIKDFYVDAYQPEKSCIRCWVSLCGGIRISLKILRKELLHLLTTEDFDEASWCVLSFFKLMAYHPYIQ